MTANGTIVAYATAPGKTASDGAGRNGVYTQQLLDAMKNGGGLPIEDVFKKTGAAVKTASKNKQNPWVNSSFYGQFCLGPCRGRQPSVVIPPKPVRPDVSKLLRTCETHFKAYRLTSGRGGTALVCYEEVLKIDSTNVNALAGLANIEAYYVKKAKRAIDNGQRNRAGRYLNKLRKVNPESPTLEALEARLNPSTSTVVSTPSSVPSVWQLLRECETHFRAQRYTVGQGGTAYDCYQAVLKKAPGNTQALAGLANIERYYVDQVEGFLNNGQPEQARNYLARLRKVNPNSPKIAEFEKRMSRNSFVAGKVFQDRLQDGSDGPEMVLIPAGRFQMGDIQRSGASDEKPVHWVSVKPFAIGKYEVTFAEYDKFAEATGRKKPSDQGWGRGNRPVMNISWHDATAYAQWLTQQTGRQYRLPTEAEWEYAARAGTTTKYWWGNKIGINRANCDGCGSRWDDKQTAPVGSFAANAYGLYDTVGNVWEWVADNYQSNYHGAPTDGTAWKKSSKYRLLRGGSFYDGPYYCRTAYRSRRSSGYRDGDRGVRVVAVAWTSSP